MLILLRFWSDISLIYELALCRCSSLTTWVCFNYHQSSLLCFQTPRAREETHWPEFITCFKVPLFVYWSFQNDYLRLCGGPALLQCCSGWRARERWGEGDEKWGETVRQIFKAVKKTSWWKAASIRTQHSLLRFGFLLLSNNKSAAQIKASPWPIRGAERHAMEFWFQRLWVERERERVKEQGRVKWDDDDDGSGLDRWGYDFEGAWLQNFSIIVSFYVSLL